MIVLRIGAYTFWLAEQILCVIFCRYAWYQFVGLSDVELVPYASAAGEC